MGEPEVTAIVVNYNSGDHLQACLDGLLADSDLLVRAIVVDNASTDGSWEVADRYSKDDRRLELERLSVNLGLAGAVNEVLDRVETDYIAILNPDVDPMSGWLQPLTALLEDDPSVAVACPLVLISETGRVNSAGQHVHVTGLGFNRHLGDRPEQVGNTPTSVGGLHGAAFVIRTETLVTLGGWDTTGFLYQEDVALSWDILLSGQQIMVVPEAKVFHDYHLTMYPEKLYLLERNRWALLLSHLRVGRLLLLGIPLLASEMLVWGLAITRGPRFVVAKWRSWTWVFSNGAAISGWRRRIFARPVYDWRNLNRNTRWSYPPRQLLGLGTERGASTRVPPGGLPV